MADPLARLWAVLEAATPGPWRAREAGRGGDKAEIVADWGRGSHAPMVVWRMPHGDSVGIEDARAIAALGTLWPALLAVAERCDRTCDWPTCSPYEHDPACPVGGLLAAIDAALPDGKATGGDA